MRTAVHGVAALVLATTAAIAPAGVTGRVLDQGGAPVAGARASREASGAPVASDASGGFTLAVADGPVTVVAAAPGFFHASAAVVAPATDVTLTLAPVPLDDDPAYHFQSPQACGDCHPAQLEQWEGSPMALAGVNTWVYDLYDGSGTAGGGNGFVYTRDSMLAEHNPASECASCHQPEPWAATPFSAMLPLAQAGSQHGVSCEVCHRMAAIALFGAKKFGRSPTLMPGGGYDTFQIGNPGLYIP